jgi:hypothetical protein
LLSGNGFNGSMVLGALFDGYNGTGQEIASAAFDDATSFIPAGVAAGVLIKISRLVKAAKLVTVSQKVLNRANHIFGPKSLGKHKLEGFLGKFSGDQVKAFQALEKATQKLADKGKIDDVFESVVKVEGIEVTVQGKVIDGIANIATAFIP